MRNLIVASLALGAVCAFIPSALADSFGYQASGSIVAAGSTFGANSAGFNPGISTLSKDGGIPFANPFNPGKFGDGSSAVADAFVEIRGNQLNLLSSQFGGYKTAGRGNGPSYYAGGSFSVGNEISIGNSELAAETATLAATPEPGSLLLLGTGLLCMALFLFRKSAKDSTES
jgi:hypothetical protein